LSPRHLLDALQDVEPAAAAVALQRIGGIGDELQLAQHELRDDQRAVEEAGLAMSAMRPSMITLVSRIL
jgi:hypothetical protein